MLCSGSPQCRAIPLVELISKEVDQQEREAQRIQADLAAVPGWHQLLVEQQLQRPHDMVQDLLIDQPSPEKSEKHLALEEPEETTEERNQREV